MDGNGELVGIVYVAVRLKLPRRNDVEIHARPHPHSALMFERELPLEELKASRAGRSVIAMVNIEGRQTLLPELLLIGEIADGRSY